MYLAEHNENSKHGVPKGFRFASLGIYEKKNIFSLIQYIIKMRKKQIIFVQ